MLRSREAVASSLAAHVVDERAAAALALRQHHLDAVAGEQADASASLIAGLQHRLGAARAGCATRPRRAPSAGKTLRPVRRRARRQRAPARDRASRRAARRARAGGASSGRSGFASSAAASARRKRLG